MILSPPATYRLYKVHVPDLDLMAKSRHVHFAGSSQYRLVACFLAWLHGHHFNLSDGKAGLVCHNIEQGEL